MTDTPALVEELALDDLPGPPPDFDACEDEGDAPVAFGLVSPRQVLVTWLPAAFDLWGVKYRVVTGWQDRGRPLSSGGFDPRGRVLVHHTGSKSSATNPHPALGTVTQGRPDLSGPLCHISTDYNGVTSIVAAGRANHAGKAKAVGSTPAGDGNTLWIGNEVDTNGIQTMPKAQYDAIVLTTCAIFHHEGVTAAEVPDHLALHATTSYSGKWDLGAGDGRSGVPYPRRDLIADVTARLKAGPPKRNTPSPTPQENDMQLSDPVNVRDPKTNEVVQVPYSTILARQDWVYQETLRQKAVLDAIAAKLLTHEEVQAAAEAGAKAGAAAALDAKIAGADVTLEVTP